MPVHCYFRASSVPVLYFELHPSLFFLDNRFWWNAQEILAVSRDLDTEECVRAFLRNWEDPLKQYTWICNVLDSIIKQDEGYASQNEAKRFSRTFLLFFFLNVNQNFFIFFSGSFINKSFVPLIFGEFVKTSKLRWESG